MNSSYFERFKEIIFDERLSTRSFELSIGKTSGYLNMMKKNVGSPGVEVIIKTIEVYPKYNLYWLAAGIGDKFVKPLEGDNLLNEESAVYNKALGEKIDQVIAQNKEILDKLERSIALESLKRMKEDVEQVGENKND